MGVTFENYIKVQQYLDDKMTPVQEAAFIEEVSADATLQEYLQFEIDLRVNRNALAKPGQMAAGETLTVPPVEQPAGEKPKGKKMAISMRTAIAIAACFLLAATGIVWYLSNRNQSNELAKKNSTGTKTDTNTTQPPKDTPGNLVPSRDENYRVAYNRYYTKDDIPEEMPDPIAEALIEYKFAKYKRLQSLDFSDLSAYRGRSTPEEINKSRELGHYYKGLSYIETKNDKLALNHFQWVMDHAKENKPLLVKATWYKALIYVKQGDMEKAIPLLTQVSENKSNPFGKKAIELLKALGH